MAHALKSTGMSRLDVAAGIACGLLGLAVIAVVLNFADPILRDHDGALFSLSELYRVLLGR